MRCGADRFKDRFTVKIMDSEKYVARRSDVIPSNDPVNSNLTDLVFACPTSRPPSISRNQVIISPTTRPTTFLWCQLSRAQIQRVLYTVEMNNYFQTEVRDRP